VHECHKEHCVSLLLVASQRNEGMILISGNLSHNPFFVGFKKNFVLSNCSLCINCFGGCHKDVVLSVHQVLLVDVSRPRTGHTGLGRRRKWWC